MQTSFFLFFVLLIGLLPSATAQTQSFTGFVRDAKDSTAVEQAEVIYKQKIVHVHKDGAFEIQFKRGDSSFAVQAIGYSTKVFTAHFYENNKIFYINKLEASIQEVLINGDLNSDNLTSKAGANKIQLSDLKKLPNLLGETDLLKSLYLFPGVQSAGESSAGFSVRGGNFDQNLILLDEATVYNPTHLFGFLSTFNSAYITDVKLIKSNIPAEYGGRMSAVVDIGAENKVPERLAGSGSMGVIAPSLKLSIPIVAKKLGLVVAFRRTFIDQIVKQINFNSLSVENGTNYYFYDFNAKLIFKPTAYFSNETSIYTGLDHFTFLGKNSFNLNNIWSNLIFSNVTNYLFSEKLKLKIALTSTTYNSNLDIVQNTNELQFISSVVNYSAKLALSYSKNDDTFFKNGMEISQNTFSPANNSIQTDSTHYKLGAADQYHSRDAAVFSQYETSLSSTLKINLGLRLTAFQQIGSFNRLVYNSVSQTNDTVRYQSNEPVATYFEFEPRIGLCYLLNERSSLKFSLTRNVQFQHQIPTSTMLTSDVWISSTDYIKPQSSYHFSAGYFKNFEHNAYETYVDSYLKWMLNVPEYNENKDLLQFNSTSNFDQSLCFGRGYSIGIEFFAKKKTGVLTGWISYTLSRTQLKMDAINNGQWFSSKFDRTHNLVVVANYRINKKWSVNSQFVYQTGEATTVPVARYMIQGNMIDVYSDKNAFRMPAYHRLDVGFTYEQVKTDRFESVFNFSIYNIYSYLNPYLIYFQMTGDLQKYNLQINAKQITLFPILPSVSWSFKF